MSYIFCHEVWLNSLRAIPRIDEPSDALRATGESMSLDHLVMELRRVLPDDAILVVDAGLHRVFAGHYWSCRTPGTFFTASTVAPMGWAIAAAIGIQVARPGRPVVVLTGDGCMLAHGNELATMARSDLPIIVVLCRNRSYGSIRRHFAANAPAAAWTSLPAVDWAEYAMAQGARGIEVGEVHTLRGALETALRVGENGQRRKGKPTLVEVPTPMDQPLPGPDVVCSALERAATSVTETLAGPSRPAPRRPVRRASKK